MTIVDTHVHVGQYWFEPVETLLFQMERNGVEKAVLTQYAGNYDNRYEIECVRKYPGRFAAVVLVDIQQPDAPDTLAMWAREGAAGVRLRPDERSPGPDPLAIWRKASELGLTVSIPGRLMVGSPTAGMEMFGSEAFHSLVADLPDLKIVLEHLGGAHLEHQLAGRQEPEPDYKVFERVLALARYPNVYIKLPDLAKLIPRPFPFREPPFEGPPPAVRMAYDAFGAHRMMWCSDYPVSGAREGYANTLRFARELIPFFSDADREWVFGKTALSVWKFQ